MNIDKILTKAEQVSINNDLMGKCINPNQSESISYIKTQARKHYLNFKNEVFMACGYAGKCGFEEIPNSNVLVPTGISHTGKIIQDSSKYKNHLEKAIVSFAIVEQYTDLLEEYLNGSESEILYLKAMSLHWLHPHKKEIEILSREDSKYNIVNAVLNPAHIVGALRTVQTAYLEDLGSDGVARNMLNEIENAIAVYNTKNDVAVFQKIN